MKVYQKIKGHNTRSTTTHVEDCKHSAKDCFESDIDSLEDWEIKSMHWCGACMFNDLIPVEYRSIFPSKYDVGKTMVIHKENNWKDNSYFRLSQKQIDFIQVLIKKTGVRVSFPVTQQETTDCIQMLLKKQEELYPNYM